MKIKKIYVLIFFVLFLINLIADILGVIFHFFNLIMGIVLVLFVILLFWILTRKTAWFKKNSHVVTAAVISLVIVGGIIGAGYWQNYEYQKGRHVLDVGGENEVNDAFSALEPSSALSERKAEFNDEGKLVTYREMLSSEAHTTLNMPAEWKKMDLWITFKDNFPEGSEGLFLGVKGEDDKSYSYQRIYYPGLDLSKYDYTEENGLYLYYINDDAPRYDSVKEFMENLPTDKTIAYDNGLLDKYKEVTNDDPEYENGTFFLNTTLRGKHQFLIIAQGDLFVNFTKLDGNAYAGADVMIVDLLDLDNKSIARMIVDDDNVSDASRKIVPQKSSFVVHNVPKGVYQLNFFVDKNYDSTIINLSINQKKVILKNEIYFLNAFSFYSNENIFQFKTWNGKLNETISINDDLLNIYYGKIFEYKTKIHDVNGYVPEGNVFINSQNPFSTSKEHYFDLSKYDLVTINNAKNSDYALADYRLAEKNGWISSTLSFGLDEFYLKDSLYVSLDSKHLDSKAFKDYTIPVDEFGVKFYE